LTNACEGDCTLVDANTCCTIARIRGAWVARSSDGITISSGNSRLAMAFISELVQDLTCAIFTLVTVAN